MRLLLGMVGVVLLSSPSALACWAGPPISWAHGVVCLDETTGEPLWEQFWTRLVPNPGLATDGRRLLIGRFWPCMRETCRATGSQDPELIASVDLLSGEPLADETLPPCKELIFHDLGNWDPRKQVTAGGDRVVGNPGEDRSITIMKGDTDEVRRIIPVTSYSDFLVLGDVVVTHSRGHSRMGIPGELSAIDARTGRKLWGYEDYFLAIGRGKDAVFASQEDRLIALDPKAGHTLWDQPLDRLRGRPKIIEHDGRVFVTTTYGNEGPPYQLYCLDARSGDLLWTYKPQGSMYELPLLFLDGRIYTNIVPSNLMQTWLSPRVPTEYQNAPIVSGVSTGALRGQFEHKSVEEVELNLRAWHALGDNSAISVLRATAVVFEGEELGSVARELADSFPPVRDPLALLEFLDEQFELNPELGPEIRRILDSFNPVPYGHGREVIGRNGRPRPQPEMDAQQIALIGWFQDLKSRVDEVPVTRLTPKSLRELITGDGHASLESLVAMHDASDDPDYRGYIRMIIYRQHPEAGSNWALGFLEEIQPDEIIRWVQLAPLEWLLEHEDLFQQWLSCGDDSVQSFAGRRLTMAEDPELVAPICVDLLEEATECSATEPVRALQSALWTLGRTGDTSYVPLIREYLDSEVSSLRIDRLTGGAESHQRRYVLREAAKRALGDLGVDVSVETVSPYEIHATPQQQRILDLNWRLHQLQEEIKDASYGGDAAAARDAAREFVAGMTEPSVDPARWKHPLLKAYETLEEWDKAIEQLRAIDRRPDEDHLLRLLNVAGRIDEVEEIAEKALFNRTAMKAAFILIDADRLDPALSVFSPELKKNPSEWRACVGLALIHFKRGELSKADSMIERAMALRPSPEDEAAFRHLVEYWIKRKQPEKARSWVHESLDRDYQWWKYSSILVWASSLPELSDTVLAAYQLHATD